MRGKDHSLISWLLLSLTFALVLSLIANVHLFVTQSKATDGPANLARSHMSRMLGDLNMLVSALDLVKEENWSDAYHLFGIQSTIESVKAQALSIVWINEVGLADEKLSGEILDSGLLHLLHDLEKASADFGQVASNRVDGESVNVQKLEQFRERIKRAKFPDQKSFTWAELNFAINRYFNER